MEEIKKQITDYWTRRTPSFCVQRMRELSGDKHFLWLNEFRNYLPERKRLKILDIGTGTGFFVFLLAKLSHEMTGIDLTEEMIREAKETAELMGISARFEVMDAEEPSFAPGTFDAIVTRNLTWGLPHLRQAYHRWHDLLKPEGILINFDADYCRENSDIELPPNHAHKEIGADMMQKYEEIKAALRPCQQPRPEWDVELLKDAGFHKIRVDTGVWERIYHDKDEFYNPTPVFAITAKA
ncbi:MAG: class I SAM-dependent methyltransferase [Clostridiales bacterium]|nr:class I SAM-dependent methyltransferase [Clostridiales bacterium]